MHSSLPTDREQERKEKKGKDMKGKEGKEKDYTVVRFH